MKNKIILVTVIAIAICNFLNLSFGNKQNNKIPSLKFTNIEALADLDATKCYRNISSIGELNFTHVTYCGDCKPHLAKVWLDENFCS